jgi:hypothetical protein
MGTSYPADHASRLLDGEVSVAIDEELSLLDNHLRRLKIEYEIYFNNPTKKPPTDLEWKVLTLLRKFSDGARMGFTQRFRYNELAQRYAIYSDLWRKKGRIREEGYRRPQDALLSVQGVRSEEHEPQHKVYGVSRAAAAAANGAIDERAFSVQCTDVRNERESVERLYRALTDAKQRSGKEIPGNIDNFAAFVQKKTDQIRKQYGCDAVEFTVETHDGDVRLKAKAKT